MWNLLHEVGWLGFLSANLTDLLSAFSSAEITVGSCSSHRKVEFPDAIAMFADESRRPYGRFVFCQSKRPWCLAIADSRGVPPGRLVRWTAALSCRGVMVGDWGEGYQLADGPPVYGAREFNLYANGQELRHVMVMDDCGTWRFLTRGEVQPFEDVCAYQRKTVQERLTEAMLMEYCIALGYDLTPDDILTDECVIFE